MSVGKFLAAELVLAALLGYFTYFDSDNMTARYWTYFGIGAVLVSYLDTSK